MLILGVESTALTASAAVAKFENGELVTYSLFTVKNKMTHSENLMPLILNAMKSMECEFSQLDAVAVSAGPGSFTGVRIGVSTVKGIAFANSLPCVAVSSLEAMASVFENSPETICAVMDARRNQFYNAVFQNGKRICADRAIDCQQLALELSGYEKVILCGDGALKAYELCDKNKTLLAASPVREQNALAVAVVGKRLFDDGKSVSASVLAPVYIRSEEFKKISQ